MTYIQAFTTSTNDAARTSILNVGCSMLHIARESKSSRTGQMAVSVLEHFLAGVLARLSTLALGDTASPSYMAWMEANMRFWELSASGTTGVRV